MPRDIQTASGIVLRNIPDRFTDGGALDLAVQRGIITAEVAAATVGDRQQVETGGILDELAIGAGHAVASRSLQVVGPRTRIEFALPPRVVCTLRVTATQAK